MIQVEAKPFLKALRQALTAVGTSKQDTNILRYIHVHIHGKELVIEATNDYVVSRVTVLAKISPVDYNHYLIISKNFARKLSKSVTKHGSIITINPSYNRSATDKLTAWKATYVDGNNVFYTDNNANEQINSGYPDLSKFIPSDNKVISSFVTYKCQLTEVLKQLYRDYKESFNKRSDTRFKDIDVVRINMENNMIMFSPVVGGGTVNTYGFKSEKLKWKSGFNIVVNRGELYQQIKYLPANEQLTLNFYGKLKPVVISYQKKNISIIPPIKVFRKK